MASHLPFGTYSDSPLLLDLATELQEEILQYLDQSDVAALYLTNHAFRDRVAPYLLGHAVKNRYEAGFQLTALQWAASHGHVELLKLLLRRQMGNTFLAAKAEYTRSLQLPLHLAIENYHLPAVQLLLDPDSQITDTDPDGNTAVHTAVTALGISQWSPKPTSTWPKVIARSFKDASSESEAILRLLLSQAPNLLTYNNDGFAPLHLASSHTGIGETTAVKMLLEFGAPVQHKDAHGITALEHAVEGWSESNVAALLGSGAAVNRINEAGRTPLHIAAGTGIAEIVRLLIENGAVVNVKDNRGMTPLGVAVSHNQSAVVRELSVWQVEEWEWDLRLRMKHC